MGIADEGMRVSFNSNDLGFISMLAALFSLLLLKKSGKKLYIVPFVFAVITRIMTMSRGANIALVIGLIRYFLLSANDKRKTARNVIIAVVSIAVLLQVMWWLIPNYFTAFSERMAVEDISNGRWDIALFYFRALWHNPVGLLFGVGIQKYNAKYDYTLSNDKCIKEDKKSIIIFKNGTKLELNLSYKILQNQILRSSYLNSMLISRKFA